MSGIYGDMLDFFPEAFTPVQYFQKQPKVGVGYETQMEGITDVILQMDKAMKLVLEDTVNHKNNVLDLKDEDYIWAPADTPLKPGFFIRKMDTGEMYRIVGKGDWEYYGGFIRFNSELIQGNIDVETETPVKPKKGAF